MPRTDAIFNNFSSGEFSARNEGRVDLPQYYTSCRTLLNMLLSPQGGAERDPGTVFVANGKNDTDKIRLTKFLLASGKYVLELGHQYIRFYKDHARIEGETDPLELETEYTLEEIFDLKYKATKDTIYFFHPKRDSKQLTRSSISTASAPVEGDPLFIGPNDIPYINDHDEESYGKGVQSSNDTPKESYLNWTITLNSAKYLDKIKFVYKHTIAEDPPERYAEAEYWLQYYDGSWHDLYHRPTFSTSESKKTKEFDAGYSNVTKIRLRSRLKAWGTGDLWAAVWSYCYEIITSDTDWVFENIPFTGEGAPDFSKATGTPPGCVTFFEQRMVLAGADDFPNRIWLSKSGDLTDFSEADGLIFDVYHTSRLKILWLESKSEIIFGADNCEGVISGEGAPISKTNYQIRVESGCGSANIQGLLARDKILFVQKGARCLNEFSYSNEKGGWYPTNLTFFADHITESGITEMALQTNPDPILWCPRNDGLLIGLTSGWHKHNTDGEYESVAVIPGSPEDEIWVSVKRTVNGITKRFIEYFKPRDFGSDQTDCFFVHCGKTYDYGSVKDISGATQAKPVVVTCNSHGLSNDQIVKIQDAEGMIELNTTNKGYYMVKNASTDTFELYHTDGTTQIDGTGFGAYTGGGTAQRVVKTVSDLGYLEGKEVDFLIDGCTHPKRTVSSSGGAELQEYANKIHVGLSYASKLKPMKLVPPGKIKSVNRITLRMYKSLGGKIGPNENNLLPLIFRKGSDLMNEPVPLFSGDYEKVFPPGWSKDGDIMFIQDDPLPMHLLALMADVVTNA